MKSKLTKDEQQVWRSCGGRAKSLTLLQHTNFHDIAKRHGLTPVAMRVGTELLAFDEATYRRAIREGQRQKNDTYCMAFYDARDCADVTGSPTTNWNTWGRVALGIGGGVSTSDYITLSAQDIGHAAVRSALIRSRGSVNSTPIISATIVVFYFAAQKRWSDPNRFYSVVEKVKGKLEKLNIVVLRSKATPLPPDDAEDINVDDLLATASAQKVEDDKDAAIVDEALSTPAVIQPALAVNQPETTEPLDAEALAALPDDEYAAVTKALFDRLTQAEALRRSRNIKALWESGELVGREQWSGKGYDRKLTMRYSDGSEQTFTNDEYGKRAAPSVPPFLPPDMQA
ncbi:hypothetical protein N9917_00955 [Deltaproteobacteria bacterium]|nr:hypothetical protein [Deltaproteobacteria bacterium]